ncbi:recombinase family protein, partial [Sphingomonas populi]
MKASEILRSLVSAIVLTPGDDGLSIDVQGDLAGILSIASNAKNPAVLRAGCLQVSLVAGTGFEPVTF